MITATKAHTIKDLNREQINLLPTKEDVIDFENKGWYVSPKILSDELLEQAIKGTKEFYLGMRDGALANTGSLANSETNQTLLNNEFVCFQKNEIGDIVFHPMISATAAILSNTTEIRLLADSLLCKKPIKNNNKGIVGWHTDKAYWPTLTSNKLLTAWIPLQDCTADMGPVLYIDESHIWRDQKEFRSFYSFKKENLSDFEKHLSKVKPNYKKSVMTIKRGQVCFHNCHTIHCSLPNTSKVDRIAIAVHLQDAENKYQKAYTDKGELIKISYDELGTRDENGDPDYRDPAIFPVLWKNNNI